jgi:DNA-binding NtrC family response regulator
MKIRILIIDNEPRWIEFAKKDLDIFEIVVAKTAKDAFAELEKDMFDLVIASSRNLKILEVIAEKYSDKRVVVTTIQPSTEEALQAYRLGAVRYFPKSFSESDLLKQVEDVIPKK